MFVKEAHTRSHTRKVCKDEDDPALDQLMWSRLPRVQLLNVSSCFWPITWVHIGCLHSRNGKAWDTPRATEPFKHAIMTITQVMPEFHTW